ncbi:MAG: hypothetical protein V7603_5494 [Micromonosporaceae bacterium]
MTMRRLPDTLAVRVIDDGRLVDVYLPGHP